MRWECRERFPRHRLQRKPLVSDPGMHHGTCVTHVPWCMSGSLTCGGGEMSPAFPAHAQPTILCIWQEAHGGKGLWLGRLYMDESGTPASYYLNQCWIIANLPPGQNFGEIWTKIQKFFVQIIAFENVISKMSTKCPKHCAPNTPCFNWDRQH